MKRRLKIGVVELLAHSVQTPALRARLIAPQTASVMPQVVAAWAEELGHQVHYAVWTSREDLLALLPEDLDVVFISAFSRAAFVAYALSRHLRARGTVTVLGGPHAMSFAQDARAHFDFICQTTDRELIRALLDAPERHEPGVILCAAEPPSELPSVATRARFIDHCLEKGARKFRLVPMLASLGCPYTCAFCVDAPVQWRGMEPEPLVEDLRFIERRYGADTLVGWHDPNFGIRFDEYLGAIERSGTRLVHCSHMSLSLMTPPNVRRLAKARFGLLGPGVESWFEFSDKAGRARLLGEAKVRHVAATLNAVQREVQHVQTNMIVGLDGDEGELPFQLSKRLAELAPGIYPTYFLVTNFYNAPLSRDLHASGRTMAMPYSHLDTNSFGNVRPRNYSWPELYDQLIALYAHAYSWPAVLRRTRATAGGWGKLVNFGRSVDEGRGYIAFHSELRRRLETDRELRAFFDGDRRAPSESLMHEARATLGRYAELLPEDTLRPERYAEAFFASGEEALKTIREPVAGAAPKRAVAGA